MNVRSTSLLLLVLCACRGAGGSAGGQPHPGAEDSASQMHGLPVAELDVEHYRLELELFPQQRRIVGECTIRLFASGAGARSLELDLVGLDVIEVLDERGGR